MLKQLAPLFRTCHALAHHARPFTDYVWQCRLDQVKGLNIGYNTYQNDKACKTFTHYIAEVYRRELAGQIKQTKFISLMIDGATDSAVMEEELMYVRFVVDGEVCMRFVGIANVDKPDAAGIVAAMDTMCKTYLGINLDPLAAKLAGFGSDGASVMMGVRAGVQAKLKEKQGNLFVVHCMAHRLELAFKDFLKTVPAFQQLDRVLLNLYLFYHDSTVRRAMLKLSYDSLGEKNLIPTRVGGTRWLPHLKRAFHQLWTGYKAIVQHLGQVSNVTSIFLPLFVFL